MYSRTQPWLITALPLTPPQLSPKCSRTNSVFFTFRRAAPPQFGLPGSHMKSRGELFAAHTLPPDGRWPHAGALREWPRSHGDGRWAGLFNLHLGRGIQFLLLIIKANFSGAEHPSAASDNLSHLGHSRHDRAVTVQTTRLQATPSAGCPFSEWR